MAQIADGGGTETTAQRNARLQAKFNKASKSKRRFAPKAPATPRAASQGGAPRAPAAPKVPTVLDKEFWVAPQGSQNILGGVADAFINKPYQDDRRYDFSSRYGTPPTTDIEERRYSLPQFGERTDSSHGLSGTLNKQQLAEAARYTGDAMFTYGKLPSVISSDVADQLPYNPKSAQFKSVMQDAFGVDGFESSGEFLTKLGYHEYEEGKW